MQVLMKC
jgi:hypothetical protein